MLDLCSRELIRYSITPRMRVSLAVKVISVAHRACLVAGDAMMHTERRSQYHSGTYRNALWRLEIRQSASSTGPCLDGAAAESFSATIKAEVGSASWPDRANIRRDTENWIIDNNRGRLHSSFNRRTPIEVRHIWQESVETAA